MSTRIGLEPIITINTGISDYRPRAAPRLPTPAKPQADGADAAAGFDAAPGLAASEPPPLPDPAAPVTAFAAALLSGAEPPHQVSVQEAIMRSGTDWVPPPSGYRLADRKI
ncbi:MAG TPA: hypothetical protein VGN80_19695 [Devosiaceae bacterium]|jgi:hypothetical protein|nr:hypothetical protein [Devosiaceae bacterium]